MDKSSYDWDGLKGTIWKMNVSQLVKQELKYILENAGFEKVEIKSQKDEPG